MHACNLAAPPTTGLSTTTSPGVGWVLGKSSHPPYGRFAVDVNNAKHPGAQGISDFMTSDELYMKIEFKDGNDVFITSDFEPGTYSRNNPQVGPVRLPGRDFPTGLDADVR